MLLCALMTFAQGGMWLPSLAEGRIKDMQSKGFRLSADDIYNVNKACMKDAVMLFGGGCTGEIVSDKGLVLTNHHCGRGYIQKHSTLDHDYLTDGFWAKSMDEELPCPGLAVDILELMDQIPQDVSKDRRELILQEYEQKYGEGYEVSIEKFYGGNLYYIFVYKHFEDVRLVGAPPSAIGNFGGDTDNWMWPRHGGDFSVFRIYADKDNKPAKYSADNKPYTPRSHFKVSIKGVQEGDFTMVFGFPGTTEEYLPACDVAMKLNYEYPQTVFVRQNIMEIYEEAMNRDPQVRINYTSRNASVENYKKKLQGALIGLRRFDVVGQKLEFEKEFMQRLNTPELKEKYGDIFERYNNIYKQDRFEVLRVATYFLEGIYPTMQFRTGQALAELRNLTSTSGEAADELINKVEQKVGSILSGRDSICERKVFERMYQIYCDSCPEYMPYAWQGFYVPNGIKDAKGFVDFYYEKSQMADSARISSLIAQYRKASALRGKKREEAIDALNKILEADAGYFIYRNFMQMYFDKCYYKMSQLTETDDVDRLYQKALLELFPEKILFPDANLTLRFTYGKVDGFEPRDGVVYKHYTTLEGVIEKDNPEIYDYNVPGRLKELYRSKDYGRYADKSDGRIHVCFAASNHTTGGNSGSPVINSEGQLIGINFDRCWEGTMSDIQYNPEICRNISVDIRYVLFLIEKLGGAKRLIDEMEIVE